jgi:hypothetical protein
LVLIDSLLPSVCQACPRYAWHLLAEKQGDAVV